MSEAVTPGGFAKLKVKVGRVHWDGPFSDTFAPYNRSIFELGFAWERVYVTRSAPVRSVRKT